MKKYNLNEFIKGWFVGDFSPSILRTANFEVGIKRYKKEDRESKHYHAIADEITVIIEGKFKMNKKILVSNDVVHLLPGEKADFECLEDGVTAVVKTPSISKDKYVID